jgi:hypothetical protein
MKIINITNGDCFNKYISQRLAGFFIPFKEAMIEGNPLFPLFDDSFCQERTNTHMSSSALEYRKHMGDFLTVNFNDFDEIVLWFGKDAFCQLNLLTVLAYLKQIDYKGNIYLNTIVDETNTVIKEKEKINLSNYINIYKSVFIDNKPIQTNNYYLEKAIQNYLMLKDDNGTLALLIKENSHLPKQELFELVLKETRDLGLSDTQVSKLIKKNTNKN